MDPDRPLIGKELIADLLRQIAEEHQAHLACIEMRNEAEAHREKLAKELADCIEENIKLQEQIVKWKAEAGKFGPGIEAVQDLLEEAELERDRLKGALRSLESQVPKLVAAARERFGLNDQSMTTHSAAKQSSEAADAPGSSPK